MFKALLAAAIAAIHICSTVAAPEVTLPDGPIRGRESTTFSKKTYYAFEKIPYATPPLNDLRFQAPLPPSKWTTTLDTTTMDVECYQQNANNEHESEDCLYLNVFTPQLPSGGQDPALPVMLYIHGGGFIGGTARGLISERIIDQDIIFVAINYRLGPFGFLSTQDEVIPGNNGLKDQQLAIRWVHDNVELFGGDPDKITIFGHSAGSASCSYQLLNQNNRGLFAGAILESGAALSPWAFQRNARKIAFNLTTSLNSSFITSHNSHDVLHFLLTVRAKILDLASEVYHDAHDSPENREILQGFYWAPVVEDKNPDGFLTRKMFALFDEGNVIGVPVLAGMTSEEDLYFYQDHKALKADLEFYDENLRWLIPDDLGIDNEHIFDMMGYSIRQIYTKDQPFSEHLGRGLTYLSDTSFTRSIIKQAKFYSKVGDVYFYEFSYDGKLGSLNLYYEGAREVGHGQEMLYLFCEGNGCDLSSYPKADQTTADRLVAIWTNFAKYQNPTPNADPLLQNIAWPLVKTEDGDFFYVDIDEDLTIQNHPRDTFNAWEQIYNLQDYTKFDTY